MSGLQIQKKIVTSPKNPAYLLTKTRESLLCERRNLKRILGKTNCLRPNPDVFVTVRVTFTDHHNDYVVRVYNIKLFKCFFTKYHCHAPLVHTFIGQNECKHTGHQGNLFTWFTDQHK